MFLITIFFSWLRPHNSVVYAPKLKYADEKHAPPKIGKGLFAWWSPVNHVTEMQMVEKLGLDAAVFLRFTRMCRNIFLIASVIGIGIILPANVIGNEKSLVPRGQNRFFTLMTPLAVFKHPPLWTHVFSAYLIDIIICFFLWQNYGAITRLRRHYFESTDYLQSLHSRTLMFIDIPPASRTDQGIMDIADGIQHTAGVPRAAIGRNVRELPDLIEQHEAAIRNLESVLAKYLKNPEKLPAKRPMMKPSDKYRKSNGNRRVDAIDYLKDRIHELETDIAFVREGVDKRNPMPYGFISYERIEEAHTVAYAARKKQPQGVTIRLAPRPNDLIWQNLPLSKKSKGWKRFTNNMWVALLTFLWIAPNALIAIFLANLSNLGMLWPAFQKSLYAHPRSWALVQGIAAPALLSLIYVVLPIIFRRISIRAGDITKTSRERHVTTKLYAFFVFNNLLVFSIFGLLWQYVATVVGNKTDDKGTWEAIKEGKFFDHLLSSLSAISMFWLTWLLQRNLGAAADLAQILSLTWGWFQRTFMAPTPRQTIEWTAPPPFDYAVFYNYFLFYSTVALCFTTLQPLVLPVTGVYFVIDYWLKKYLLLYVFLTKTESGGLYWRIIFNRFIFAMLLSNSLYALVLMSKGTWTMIYSMVPLIPIVLGFKFWCAHSFDDQIAYYTKATLKDPAAMTEAGQKARKGGDKVMSRFGHPALYKPLMTPMVHAKAQQATSQIYRGRLSQQSDGATSVPHGYSDIAMGQMSHDHPGKSARFAPENSKKEKDLFEVVPEGKLDFGYFMDRSDFRDELGGDGELFGRPQDLISERSGTPHSFMSRQASSNSITSSRTASPDTYSRDQSRTRTMQHPAYRDVDPGDMGAYSMRNGSESRLLSGAQPPGMAGDEVGHEQYGLDRWRTGGSGYTGVPGSETPPEAFGYEAYRRGR